MVSSLNFELNYIKVKLAVVAILTCVEPIANVLLYCMMRAVCVSVLHNDVFLRAAAAACSV